MILAHDCWSGLRGGWWQGHMTTFSGHIIDRRVAESFANNVNWARILVHVMIYRRLLIGRDDNLDQSEAYDISSRYDIS